MTPARTGSGVRGESLAAFARAIWWIGIRGEPQRRRWFWRLLRVGMGLGAAGVARAVEFSIVGEHFIRYTAEDVLPRLECRLAELRVEASGAVQRGIAAGPEQS